jgi:hypothetical protein
LTKSKATKAAYARAWSQRTGWGGAYRKQNLEATLDKERRYRAANRERYAELRRIYERDVRKPLIEAEKLRRGACLDCGLVVTKDTLVIFDFDHRDPSIKRSGINRTSTHYLAEEMAKCDLRCANCHRLKTSRMKEFGPRKVPANPVINNDTLF